MSYSEQVRDPGLALNPQQQKQKKENSGVDWWKWLLVLLVVKVIVLVLIYRYRPEWLVKLGIYFGGSGGLGGNINPMGWV